jgi:hypothetical protein
VAAPQLLQDQGRLEQVLKGQAVAATACTFARLSSGSDAWVPTACRALQVTHW